MTPQIAKRAYELYEERARKDGSAAQDWKQAERETRKEDAKAESKPDANAEPKPQGQTAPPTDLTPQLVKRVHELYENLGREEVQAVEEMEKTKRKNREDGPDR